MHPHAPATRWNLAGGVCSRAAPGRASNEDAAVCGPVWFAVADGIGGHRSGDEASAAAVEHLRSAAPPGSPSDVGRVIDAVDRAVRDRARRIGAAGMGSTIAGLVRVGDDLVVFHVGDARCYQLHDGRLRQLTRDHSHVQELVDAGLLTLDEAGRHRLRHVITRALGVGAGTRADVALVAPPVGRFLVCSDGLTSVLEAHTIGRVLTGVDAPLEAAERLVDLAVRGGARDDVTALVIDHPRAVPSQTGAA